MENYLAVFNTKLSVEEYVTWFNTVREDFEEITKDVGPEKRLELVDRISYMINELTVVKSQLEDYREDLVSPEMSLFKGGRMEDFMEGRMKDPVRVTSEYEMKLFILECNTQWIRDLIDYIANLPRARIVKKTDEYQKTVQSLKSTKKFIHQLRHTRRKLLLAG